MNINDGTVYVIDTATNTVAASVPVESFPVALGQFRDPSVTILAIQNTAGAERSAGAERFGDITLKTDSCTGFVDFLKFPKSSKSNNLYR